MERKNMLIVVGAFVCGLVVGGILVHLYNGNETDAPVNSNVNSE